MQPHGSTRLRSGLIWQTPDLNTAQSERARTSVAFCRNRGNPIDYLDWSPRKPWTSLLPLKTDPRRTAATAAQYCTVLEEFPICSAAVVECCMMDTTAPRRQLHTSLTKSFGRDSAVGRALCLLYGPDVTGRDVGNRFSALNMETKASAGRFSVCTGECIVSSLHSQAPPVMRSKS